MKLPHIKNSQVAQEVAEAVFTNEYELQLFPPSGIPQVNWLVDEIVSISGLDKIDELPEIKVQTARGFTRVYSSPFVESTHLELELKINLNAHGRNADQIVIYEMFKQWARRNRDERTGVSGLKIDAVGSGQLIQQNKAGFVWRRLDFQRILVQSISMTDEIAFENGDPVQLTVKVVVEQWEPKDAGTI